MDKILKKAIKYLLIFQKKLLEAKIDNTIYLNKDAENKDRQELRVINSKLERYNDGRN